MRAELDNWIWPFLRGDLSPLEFERWVYANDSLEEFFGNNLCLEEIAANYADREERFQIKKLLRTFAANQFDLLCACITHENVSVIDMAPEMKLFNTVDEIKKRGDPYWWLYCSMCRQCGQHWLVALEERQNDVVIVKRLDADAVARIHNQNVWPNDFDKYEDLLRIGREAGNRWRHLDPLCGSLYDSVVELAKTRPGIKLGEICTLLNLEYDDAAELCAIAMQKEAVSIDMPDTLKKKGGNKSLLTILKHWWQSK